MHCLDRGIHINRRHIWPHNSNRLLKDTDWWIDILDRIEAGLLDAPAFGVKGQSMLFELDVDPFRQNAFNFLHNAYEGVFNRIIKSVFGKLV